MLWLPMYATSSTVCLGSSRCTLNSQRILYGLTVLGSMKLMELPRNVAAPLEAPDGCRKPVGNGLDSVEGYGGSSAVSVGMGVFWLKPGEFGVGSWIGSTSIPMPPRITVLSSNRWGVQANPTRGLKIFELL